MRGGAGRRSKGDFVKLRIGKVPPASPTFNTQMAKICHTASACTAKKRVTCLWFSWPTLTPLTSTILSPSLRPAASAGEPGSIAPMNWPGRSKVVKILLISVRQHISAVVLRSNTLKVKTQATGNLWSPIQNGPGGGTAHA